ncbi:hypothetical protein QAD02_023811 [Eretmocerus hayati]|uniref:Uncharacterized protein n=2 Tax=Eretmocerus hayati TaxID=131215 RepID=A0ACC2PBG6_9HYME|nr:hypothetical protein QAD02_016113 [Eretmocerus hayati]KAJ8688016.1 hypothetical protein QAD02_023811 [Eretmocerus hayati]
METGMESGPSVAVIPEDLDLEFVLEDVNEMFNSDGNTSVAQIFDSLMEEMKTYESPLPILQPSEAVNEQAPALASVNENVESYPSVFKSSVQELIPYTSISLRDQEINLNSPLIEASSSGMSFKRALLVKKPIQPLYEEISPSASPQNNYVLETLESSQVNYPPVQFTHIASAEQRITTNPPFLTPAPSIIYTDPQSNCQRSRLIEPITTLDSITSIKFHSDIQPVDLSTEMSNSEGKSSITSVHSQIMLDYTQLNPTPGTSTAPDIDHLLLQVEHPYTKTAPIQLSQSKETHPYESEPNSVSAEPLSLNTSLIETPHTKSVESPLLQLEKLTTKRNSRVSKARSKSKYTRSSDKIIAALKEKITTFFNNPPTDFPAVPFKPFSSDPIMPFRTWIFCKDQKFLLTLLLAIRGKLEMIPNHVQHLHVTLYVKPDKSNWRCLFCAGQKNAPQGWDIVELHAVGLSKNILLKSCPGCHSGFKPKNSIVGCSQCCCIWILHKKDIEKGKNFKSVPLSEIKQIKSTD